jgi:hypothetical protein
MPDRHLPTPLPLVQIRRILAEEAPRAFEGLRWECVGDVYFVEFPAQRRDGTIDSYLTKWTFFHYPDWPPHVTFVNPETKLHDPSYWPATGSDRLSLNPTYGDAPEGLICNSMFFDWYFYGGHGVQPAVSWQPGVHRAAATVAELMIHLQPPYYQGPR